MSTSKKPVIILVHGAWHRPVQYTSLIDPLKADGYTVVTPTLETAGDGTSIVGKTIADDVKVIHQTMAPYLDAGEEIVLLCHSFGGMSGTDSVIGNSVIECKEKGLSGGVKAVIYLAAFAPPEGGLRLFDLIRIKDESEHPDWWSVEDNLILLNDKALDVLYGDVDGPDAKMHMDRTVNQSLESFRTPSSHGTNEVKAPITYIATKEDKAVPYVLQEALTQAAKADAVLLECGHSPFAKTEEAAAIVEVVKKVAKGE